MNSQWNILLCHEVIMTSHGLHYGIGLMELVLQLDLFLHSNIKDKIHSKILIFSPILGFKHVK